MGPYSGWDMRIISGQVNLKKKFFSDVLIIVNLGEGYEHKNFSKTPDQWGRSTQGINVHLSCNGPLQLSFEEWDEINYVGNRAKRFLESSCI